MEIQIKTIDEFRSENVTIELTGTPEEAHRAMDRLMLCGCSTDNVLDQVERAGESWRIKVLTENYAAARAKIVDLEGQLEKLSKGHVCTEKCQPNAHHPFVGRKYVEELKAKAASDAGTIEGLRDLIVDLETQLARAEFKIARLTTQAVYDPNQAAEVLAENYARSRARILDLEGLLSQATFRIAKAIALLENPEITATRGEVVSRKAVVLANAIDQAVTALRS